MSAARLATRFVTGCAFQPSLEENVKIVDGFVHGAFRAFMEKEDD